MVRSRFSLIACVLFAAVNAYAQCPTTAEAASPTSPVNTTLVAGSKIHYKWNLSTASGVSAYAVSVRASGNTGSGTPECTATSSSDTCDGSVLPAGNYEWSVRTFTANCNGGTGSPFQPFVVTACSAPSAPTLTSPANNSTITSNPPTLQWTAVSGAGSYDIHINNTVATSSTNSFTPPTLAAGNYSWYVEAIASCSNTQRTRSASTFAFTVPTATCPDAATLQTPAEGSTVASGAVTLSWKPSSINTTTAPTYLIFAGINGATPTQAGSTNNTQATFTIDSSKSIEWYVVTRTTNCPDVTSAHGHFSTATTCPTAGPTITAPATGSSFDDSKPVTVNWNAVSGATSYDILVSSDNGANFTQKATFGAATLTASLNFAAGTYILAVRANASNCPSMISQPAVRFTVVAATACPTARPALISPANGATVTLPVTFDWSDVDGASGYNVYVITSNSTSASVLAGSSTKSELTVTSLPSGTSAWFVQALFDNCSPTESAHNTITINASSSCSTTAPSLVSPANNSTVSNPVTFDWSDVSGATAYRLVVAFNGGSPIAIATSTDSSITSTLPAGSYEWYVEAIYGTACPSIASTHFKFTLASANACSTTAPATVSPADGATSLASPVTLQWTAVSGAIEYKVFASINGTTALVADTTSTTASVKLPTGSVTWFVEALFSGDCAPTVSKRASFNVTTGSSCANNAAPALQSPPENATDVKSPVTFQWQRVDGATSYTLFVSQNGGDFVNFGTTTDHQLERIVAPGTFAWYVAASFAGCDDTHSSTFHFTVPSEQSCPTGTITLNAPAEGATVNSPVAMSWSAINGATSYRVHVSSNGEAFAVLAHPTTNSATVTLPSGSVEWYVEALFNTNATTSACPSIVSNRAKFTVARAATCDSNKAAVANAPSGTTSNDEIDFTWSAAAGAVAYRVWLAPQGQPFGDIGFTTSTTLSRDLDPGTYSWYVESFFSGCPALNSNTLTFTINTPRCSNDAATLISPADGATNVTSPVTLLWSAVANAEGYRVFASLDDGQEVLIGETNDTSITKSVLPGKIKWRVETIFDDCPSTKSKSSSFTVPKAQNCTGDAAQLVAPVDGVSLTTNDVDLIWNAVSGARRYIVFIRHNDGAPTAIAETEETHKPVRLPDGKIEWWIVTFVSGCPVTESSHATFTITTPCDNKKPLLQSPRDESSVTQPVIFNWSPVANATGYRLFAAIDDNGASLVDSTTTATQSKPIPLPNGIIRWFVEATFSNCPSTRSALGIFRVVPPPPCGTPAKPLIQVAATVASASTYNVRWTNVANANAFELQESSTPDFAAPTSFTVAGTSQAFTHTATTAPVIYFYRVRAVSACNDERGAFSSVVSIVILPPKNTANTEAGNTNKVVTQLFIPGSTTPLQFTAHADKPWITIAPSSGTLPTTGITLTVTSDPGPLNLGTNTGTISISFTGATSNGAANLVTAVNIPVSVSLVTPVSTGGKNTPPPDSLIIPAVGHASGVGNSLFESDVRLANTSAQIMKYQLNFTPAGADGTVSGNSTQIQVDPGSTMALNDILANFFGGGTAGAVGTLEIRPLTSTTATSAFTSTSSSNSQSLTTVVSSRTYNSTTNGTFGQFIPAVPFSQFIGKSSDQTQKQILSLQQIAQNSAYRTNFGIVEGAGEPVSVLLSVFDSAGNRVAQIPETLPAGGFLQFNSLLEANGITLADGRVEVEVTSDTGRVTAYASVLDNITSDPLLVSPVNKTTIGSSRYILPGIGDFDIGIAHWKSDVRIYNAGATRANATLTYYPQGAPGSPRATTISIDPGETKAINDFIATEFPMTGTAGSLVVSTPSSSSLVASARTYTDQGANKGTYGQFIPAVTPDTSTSLGGRTLQVLQLEASDQFRSNIGLVETSGAPASVEVSVVLPDSRVTPKTTYNLAANEFRQISLGVDFALSNVYNVRVAVRVTSGTGKVTAYGSVIDATTQDPTYVPAQ